MAQYDLANTTTSTEITDYTVPTESTDGVSSKETFWYNNEFNKHYGKYINVAKLNISINAYATWVLGMGWISKINQIELENMTGWGEDSFTQVMWNMLVIKKVNGDSFAEIVRSEEGNLINLKPLDPTTVVTVGGEKGEIVRYEIIVKGREKNQVVPVEKMFHLSNDRVADNMHGQSVIKAVEWNIEAQEEARRVHRRKVKNSGVLGVLESDTDNTTDTTTLKTPIKKAMEEGTLLIYPKDTMSMKPWDVKLYTQDMITWLNYLDDEFFQMIGIPKIIIGGSGQIEGDSKISYTAYEQFYKRSINDLQDDLWNQLAVRVEFNTPVSIASELASNEVKNASQTGFQSNDTTAGVGV